jgi:hypothetical protein
VLLLFLTPRWEVEAIASKIGPAGYCCDDKSRCFRTKRWLFATQNPVYLRIPFVCWDLTTPYAARLADFGRFMNTLTVDDKSLFYRRILRDMQEAREDAHRPRNSSRRAF